MKVITDRYYGKAKETRQLILKDSSFISFTRNFKYLGSWISYHLTGSYDILSRVKKANQATGALKFFWQANEVDVKSKYLIYMAIPLNLLLWGCDLMKRLEVFHMRCLRRILDIRWNDVVDNNKISNKKVRTFFNNIRKVESLIAKRLLLFVGKIIRMHCKKIPARLISAFIYKKDLKEDLILRLNILF